VGINADKMWIMLIKVGIKKKTATKKPEPFRIPAIDGLD
jgi:hypothetical protein